MKRRINSTGRKRIKRENVEIRMLEAVVGQPLQAKVSLDLTGLGFPESASVAIEAYHRSSGMRFECGNVASLDIPPVLVLDRVDHSGSVLFRIKVVDNDNEPGMLLGSAERIQPRSEDDAEGRRSLFPVLYRDLGPEIWKVEINPDDRPKLMLNLGMPGFTSRLQENPLLQGLLLPAALRIVLEELVGDPDDVEDDEDGWKEEWKQYCTNELGIPGDPADLGSKEERLDWVDDAVSRFCSNHAFMKRIRESGE